MVTTPIAYDLQKGLQIVEIVHAECVNGKWNGRGLAVKLFADTRQATAANPQ